MRRYLIHCPTPDGKQNVGAIIDVPSEWSSDDYGAVQEAFVSQFGTKTPNHPLDRYATMTDMHEHDKTTNGVYYDWSLAGPDGAAFTMLRLPDVSFDQLNAAVREIRRQRDVVRLHKLTIHRLENWNPTPFVGATTHEVLCRGHIQSPR